MLSWRSPRSEKSSNSILVRASLYALLSSLGLALLSPPRLASADEKSSAARGFGVSSESPTATRDAAAILQSGGNAVDAAVVATLVAGVASPTSSGIGGGGFALVWDAEKKTSYIIDFRETAPTGLKRDAFENESKPSDGSEALDAHEIGVPGEVRGLYELHKRAGKKKWAELVQIAAKRATVGYPVSQHLASMLSWAQKKLQHRPGFAGLFYPGGKPAIVGARLTHPALGKSLEKIAAQGPDAFYEGEIAEDLVNTAQAAGGTLSLQDLKNYRVKERQALSIDYEGDQILTMPPPSAGGLMVAEVLALFPSDYLRNLKHGSPAYQHLIAEGMRAAVADRMRYLSDPDFEKVDLQALLNEQRMAKRRESITLDRTHALPRFGLDEKGTHALLTADRGGNVVSLTTTVNHLFGSKIYAEKSGIFLNNELGDFSTKEDVEAFGMPDTPNRARPLARPVSSMTPTIVIRDGAPIIALGGSGGKAIATNATQTLLAALVFDHSAKTAVSADRIYIPNDGRSILVEKGTAEAHQQDLRERGEVVGTMPFTSTGIQMIKWTDKGIEAAADPRKFGLAISGR